MLPNGRSAMTRTHFAEGQILFSEGEPSDSVFRLLSGFVEVVRELDGDSIVLGRVGAVRAASEIEVEILTPSEFLDQIAGSPRAARELIQRLSQRLREADDRIVDDERRSGRVHGSSTDTNGQMIQLRVNRVDRVNGAYLAAQNQWLQHQLHTPIGLGNLPFVVGRGPVAGEEPPPLRPHLTLEDIAPFRLSRNHFVIEKRGGGYHVRDLCSTLGTIVNGEPIGDHFRRDDALLRGGGNEVIAGGVDSPFVFSVFIA